MVAYCIGKTNYGIHWHSCAHNICILHLLKTRKDERKKTKKKEKLTRWSNERRNGVWKTSGKKGERTVKKDDERLKMKRDEKKIWKWSWGQQAKQQREIKKRKSRKCFWEN